MPDTPSLNRLELSDKIGAAYDLLLEAAGGLDRENREMFTDEQRGRLEDALVLAMLLSSQLARQHFTEPVAAMSAAPGER